MTRQCAWCDCYLNKDVAEAGSEVTHGICERCAERVLRSPHQVSPFLEDIVLAAQTRSGFVDADLKHVA